MNHEEIKAITAGMALSDPETAAHTAVALAPYDPDIKFVQVEEDTVGEEETTPTVH